MSSEIFLEIAGITVRISSNSVLTEDKEIYCCFFKGFFLKEKPEKIDIDIEVKVKTLLPFVVDKETIFKTQRQHIDIVRGKGPKNKLTKSVSWLLSEKDGEFLLEGEHMRNGREGETRRYLIYLNKDFNGGKIFIPPAMINKRNVYQVSQIVSASGSLQIIFILYLARNKLGILAHAFGIEDRGRGILFVGPTGSGKTTMARLWHGRRNITILNEDRVIIREIGQRIYLCGVPWGGHFNACRKIVELKKLFFIHHYEKINKAISLRPRNAFNKFFPNIFPPFWDKEGMDFSVDFLFNILNKIPSYSLNFIKDRSIVEYVQEGKY